jgi:hypothetical protein
MNEVGDAIERIGGRFDPAGVALDDLARRRSRMRTRRRVTAGAFALAVTAAGSSLVVQAFLASTPQPPSKVRVAATWPATRAAVIAAETNCPTPTGDSPPPVSLSSTSGPAGSVVDVSGTFRTGDLFLQLWWNADPERIPESVDPPPWPPTGPDLRFEPARSGPVVELASVAGPGEPGDCSFRTRFTVPNVDPGTYQVLWAFGAVSAPPGYGLFTSAYTFEVTD